MKKIIVFTLLFLTSSLGLTQVENNKCYFESGKPYAGRYSVIPTIKLMNEDGTQVYSGNSYGDGKLATFVLNNFNSLPCTLKFRSCSLKKAENYDDFILLYVNEKDSESFSTSKGHRANSINTIRKVVEFFQKQGICKVSGLELLDN